MSEEKNNNTETTKDNDALVSNTELENIEKEILSKDQEAKEKLQKEVEARVRKELETEQKLKDLTTEKEKLEAVIKKQADTKDEELKAKDEELKTLNEKVGSTKAIRNVDSPFNKTPGVKTNFGENLNSEQVQDVNEASMDAFLEHHNLSRSQWKGKREQ